MPVVLCYGDSNTHGTPPMDGPDDRGRFDKSVRWPRVMARELGEDFEVIEAGLPGRTTVLDDPFVGAWKNGLAVLPAVLNTHRPLDLVVIMLGTNDLRACQSFTAQDIAEACGVLAMAVATSGTGPEGGAPGVLLVAPPRVMEVGPFAEQFAGAAQKSALLAKRIGATAARLGVPMFDAGSVIGPDPRDGIHFSAEAQQTLGRALAGPVREALKGED